MELTLLTSCSMKFPSSGWIKRRHEIVNQDQKMCARNCSLWICPIQVDECAVSECSLVFFFIYLISSESSEIDPIMCHHVSNCFLRISATVHSEERHLSKQFQTYTSIEVSNKHLSSIKSIFMWTISSGVIIKYYVLVTMRTVYMGIMQNKQQYICCSVAL